MYPLLFKPVYKDYLWGGEKIKGLGRAETPSPCAESWEVSAHPDGLSVVENGEFAGRDLADLCAEHGAEISGTYAEDPARFPLLMKLIDAKDRLSVQVHPNEDSAARHGGEPKTEMWYFLDSDPGAVVCAGFKEGVGPRIFADAVRQKQVSALLRAVPAERGKAIFIPGGMVHAICEGCFVYEVQQSSNTTYRIHDWDRVGADGRPRELHLDKAENAIAWKMPPMDVCEPVPMKCANADNKCSRIVRSDFFTMKRYALASGEPFDADGTTFHAWFAEDGEIDIVAPDGASVRVPAWRTCLVPASFGAYTVKPAAGGATALFISL